MAVARRIRAVTPAPGAWTVWRGARLKLGPVTVAAGVDPLPAGQLRVERDRVLVGTATDPVVLGPVAPAGKQPMPATAWVRGVRPEAGSRSSDRPDRSGRRNDPAGRGRPEPRGRERDRRARRGRPERRPPSDPARFTAYQAVAAVHRDDAYANLLLPRLITEADLTGRDAAFTTELVYGTLRRRGTLDAVIEVAADRSLDRIDPPARDLLRLGVDQLLYTRVPPHAAVAETVTLAGRVATGATGFINAVLRRVAERSLEQWLAEVAPAVDTDGRTPGGHPQPPAWVVRALQDALGGDLAETAAAVAAKRPGPGAPVPPRTLRRGRWRRRWAGPGCSRRTRCTCPAAPRGGCRRSGRAVPMSKMKGRNWSPWR